jgi:hypothetical protein
MLMVDSNINGLMADNGKVGSVAEQWVCQWRDRSAACRVLPIDLIALGEGKMTTMYIKGVGSMGAGTIGRIITSEVQDLRLRGTHLA